MTEGQAWEENCEREELEALREKFLMEKKQFQDEMKLLEKRIKEEQERKAAERQNYIATVIAVFGLISIIAAVLQIVDLMVGGSEQMIVSFWLSCLVVVLFGISWIILLLRKK